MTQEHIPNSPFLEALSPLASKEIAAGNKHIMNPHVAIATQVIREASMRASARANQRKVADRDDLFAEKAQFTGYTPLSHWNFDGDEPSKDSTLAKKSDLRHAKTIEWQRSEDQRIQEAQAKREKEKVKKAAQPEPPDMVTDLALTQLAEEDRQFLLEQLDKLRATLGTASTAPPNGFEVQAAHIRQGEAEIQAARVASETQEIVDALSPEDQALHELERFKTAVAPVQHPDLPQTVTNIDTLVREAVEAVRKVDDRTDAVVQATEILRREAPNIFTDQAIQKMEQIRVKYGALLDTPDKLVAMVQGRLDKYKIPNYTDPKIRSTSSGYTVDQFGSSTNYTEEQLYQAFVAPLISDEVYKVIYHTQATVGTTRLEEDSVRRQDQSRAKYRDKLYDSDILVDLERINGATAMNDETWDMMSMPDSTRPKQTVGRLYVNARTEFAPEVMQILHKNLSEYNRSRPEAEKIHVYGKMLRHSKLYPDVHDPHDTTNLRPDKIVLYFDKASTENILHLMDQAQAEISQKHPTALSPDRIPFGTGQVLGADGRDLTGFAFAEDPPRSQSFGGVISTAIAEMMAEAVRSKTVLNAAYVKSRVGEYLASAHLDQSTPFLFDPVHSSYTGVERAKLLKRVRLKEATSAGATNAEKTEHAFIKPLQEVTALMKGITNDPQFESLPPAEIHLRARAIEEIMMVPLKKSERVHERRKEVERMIRSWVIDENPAEFEKSEPMRGVSMSLHSDQETNSAEMEAHIPESYAVPLHPDHDEVPAVEMKKESDEPKKVLSITLQSDAEQITSPQMERAASTAYPLHIEGNGDEDEERPFIEGKDQKQASISFSDGDRIEMPPEAQMEVGESTSREVSFELSQGALEVQAPQMERAASTAYPLHIEGNRDKDEVVPFIEEEGQKQAIRSFAVGDRIDMPPEAQMEVGESTSREVSFALPQGMGEVRPASMSEENGSRDDIKFGVGGHSDDWSEARFETAKSTPIIYTLQ